MGSVEHWLSSTPGIIAMLFIAIIISVLIAAIFISNVFYDVAREKGYNERRYFWIPFLFGVVGYLLVIALPDRGRRKE